MSSPGPAAAWLSHTVFGRGQVSMAGSCLWEKGRAAELGTPPLPMAGRDGWSSLGVPVTLIPCRALSGG